VQTFPSLLDAAGVLVGGLIVAFLLGAVVWAVSWAVISTFLEKRPRLSNSLGRWRFLRLIAAVCASVAPPDETSLFLERVHDRDLHWRARLGTRREARQILCFTALGFLILGTFYLWGAYKRSVRWYAIEPPPDTSAGINGPLRPDSSAWTRDWTVRGVFWSKDACLRGIRSETRAAQRLEHEVRSFVAARRCIAVRDPRAPTQEPDSDWEPSDDPDH
jgi:MFS family permease